MEFLVLTKVGGILGPFATVLGIIMDWLFKLTSIFGIQNIGLCIILFTLVTKLLMFPLTLKQQKSSKLMSIMQPELNAIQAKYKGKSDQESMMKQNVEIQALYEKYGTSMTGGCLQLVIQMPILFALYQVIYHIPAYVSSVKDVFMNVVTSITALGVDHVGILTQFATDNKVNMARVKDIATKNGLVDFLYQLNPTQWAALQDLFPSIQGTIVENAAKIEHMNSFLGINLASTPFSVMFPNGFAGGFNFSLAILIPILAGLSQWLSARLMTVNQPTAGKDDGNSMAQSMKMMNTMMPLMSVFFCFTFASGIGIYWIVSAIVRMVQQVFINKHLSKMSVDDMIEKNKEKAQKKKEKRGEKAEKINAMAQTNTKSIKSSATQSSSISDKEREEKLEKARANAKPGSLASKANMVKNFNENK